MDEKNLLHLDIKQNKSESPKKINKKGLLQTNPILRQMFFENLINKKNKFSLKDLFR